MNRGAGPDMGDSLNNAYRFEYDDDFAVETDPTGCPLPGNMNIGAKQRYEIESVI
jgi:hypothetical protein